MDSSVDDDTQASHTLLRPLCYDNCVTNNKQLINPTALFCTSSIITKVRIFKRKLMVSYLMQADFQILIFPHRRSKTLHFCGHIDLSRGGGRPNAPLVVQ